VWSPGIQVAVDELTWLLSAATLECRLQGAALLVVMGAIAFLSRPIADALLRSPGLITSRDPGDGERRGARRLIARIGRWMLLAWSGAGAVGGLLVVLGVLDCR
jgi:hypothetical protein